MKNFDGNVLFLDRSDINTDEIIPAKYLTELTKEALKPFALEDLKLDGFQPKRDITGKSVIITRANFGCGSSREHAPWALEQNGIFMVIAENFARIFRQNMFNCGCMAISLEKPAVDQIFKEFYGKETSVKTDWNKKTFTFQSEGKTLSFPFTLSGYDSALVEAGGWVDYADSKY